MALFSRFRTLFTRLTSLQELLVYAAIWLLVYQLLIEHKPKRYIISAIILLTIFCSFQFVSFRHRTELIREMHHIERPHLPPPPPSVARGHMLIPTPVLMNMIIALMMFGVNMAIVLLFKQQREQEKIKALETSRLQHELKYLKAQINPHLFMNTLNNPPLVVFITAYAEYAVDSYKVQAVDYLLKPYGFEDLQRAASNVMKRWELRVRSKISKKKEEEPSDSSSFCADDRSRTYTP